MAEVEVKTVTLETVTIEITRDEAEVVAALLGQLDMDEKRAGNLFDKLYDKGIKGNKVVLRDSHGTKIPTIKLHNHPFFT